MNLPLRKVLIIGTRCAIALGVSALALALLQIATNPHSPSPAPQFATYFQSHERGVAAPGMHVVKSVQSGSLPNAWALAQLAIITLVCVPLARVLMFGSCLLREQLTTTNQRRHKANVVLFICAVIVVCVVLAGLAGITQSHN